MEENFEDLLNRLESPYKATPVQGDFETDQYESLLQTLEYKHGLATTEAAAPEPIDYTKRVYSESNLVEDDYFLPIQNYMVERFGSHIKDYDREEVVEMFTNNMRGFSGGNSVRAVNEITYLNSLGEDEEKLRKVGEAYTIYENMQGLFGETGFGEKAEVVGDFTRAAVFDPVNFLSLGIGKVFSGSGFKAGSQVALISAKKAFEKELAKGATRKAAQEVAEGVLKAQAARMSAETTKRIAQRAAVEQSAKTTLQRMTTSIALKEAAVVGGFEAAISAGTDYLYQDAMLRTYVQEDYNKFQTGLAAVVGLVAGGLSGAASNVGTGTSKLAAPSLLKTSPKGAPLPLSSLLTQTPATTVTKPVPGEVPVGNWLADVAKGKELADQDSEFFAKMLLGDAENGLKGLAHILLEEGYAWVPRTPDDKVSNWVGDIIRQSDPQNVKQFLEDFTRVTGIEMAEGKALTLDSFVDTFKKKMSDSGKLLKAASDVAKMLGRSPKDITLDDYGKVILGGGAPEIDTATSGLGKRIGKRMGDLINRDLPDFQNNIIRLMVSNLSTTALNVTGFAAATALNSASDVVRAALLGGKAGLSLVYNPAEAKKLGISAYSILQNQISKARNTLDVNATYDTFLKYAQARPEPLRQLTSVLPGGVESLEKITKGFEPDRPLLTLQVNQAVDYIQRLNLVSAQDGYTKAIEFTSQLDKFLRRSKEQGGFGMSWNEFFSLPDHPQKMLSERFVKIEAAAVDETLKAVFSKSYKGKNVLGEVAGVIEDARNLPGIGLLVPFGRFFNNTVAMTYQMTAIGPLIAKAMGGQQDKFTTEIVAKGIVSWSLIGILAQREQEFMKMGLGWSEEVDIETGEVVDERYEFPYGAYKAIARLVAHRWSNEEIPQDLVVQLGDQFIGQLTRQLGEAGTGISEIATALLSEEGDDLAKILKDATGTIASQAISGITRPLEPINTLVGLSRDEDFYVPDRKQGTKWVNNSLRYMDQMVGIVTGNLAPEVYTVAEGKPTVQASRLISTTRASELSNFERVMNAIGKPSWSAGMASLSEVADNRYNQIFNEIIEKGSEKLFNSKKFKEGDLETRKLYVTKLLESARKSTKAYMGRVAANSNDRALLKIIEISAKGEKKVMNVLRELGFERGLDELSEEELDVVANALKFREDYLLQR